MTRTSPFLLALLIAAGLLATSTSAQASTRFAVGCYNLRVGEWDRRVDESTLRDMPRTLALESGANGAPNEGRITFGVDSLAQRSSFRTPSWALNGKNLVLVWGEKWTWTVITLKRTDAGWKGTAEEKNDVVSMWPWRRRPRARVELTAQSCS